VLTGVPIAIKDVLTVQGLVATAGSKILQNYRPPYTATSVERLQRAGMIIVGKTNCDEFAMGSSNENSAYGTVLNPLDITRVPGGSSGGSAAAVAGGLAPVALGTDTGGSVRQPAAFCGLYGLKPTYGRVSRYGLMSMASSLDTVGIFSQTAEDAALLLQTIAGHDAHDSTSSAEPVPHYFQHCRQPSESLKIGLPKQYYLTGLDERIKKDDSLWYKLWAASYDDDAGSAIYKQLPTIFTVAPFNHLDSTGHVFQGSISLYPLVPNYDYNQNQNAETYDAERALWQCMLFPAMPMLIGSTITSKECYGPIFFTDMALSVSGKSGLSPVKIDTKFIGGKGLKSPYPHSYPYRD
jgi:hypothetical protein